MLLLRSSCLVGQRLRKPSNGKLSGQKRGRVIFTTHQFPEKKLFYGLTMKQLKKYGKQNLFNVYTAKAQLSLEKCQVGILIMASISGQVNVWQSATLLRISCKLLLPTSARLEEPVTLKRQSYSSGATNNTPYPKMT